MKSMLDLELVLLEELGFNLVLFSPYDALAQLATDAGHPTLLAAAWGVVSDAHCTPLVLCHPPHVISVAALVTVCVGLCCCASYRQMTIQTTILYVLMYTMSFLKQQANAPSKYHL